MTAKDLIMYSRSTGCPFVSIAKRVLEQYAVPYHEIFIDKDPEARQRVLDWTGFLSVPTMIIANPGEELPFTSIAPLAKGASPRGIDRGPMLTEGNTNEVTQWLKKNGFIQDDEITS